MKNFITTILAVSMLASMSTAVFAEDTQISDTNVSLEIGAPVIPGDIMLINEEASKFTSEEVEVSEVSENEITVKAENATKYNAENTVIFDLTGEKKTLEDVKEGTLLTLYFDVENENTLAFAVIKTEEPSSMVMIDKFSASETLGEYVSSNEELAINIGEESVIVDLEGNTLKEADIEDKYIAVFYSMSTMSIPPITNPDKIIVLDTVEVENEEVAGETVLNISASDVKTDGEIKLVPVRKYAESLELTVGWNGEDKSVTVGTVPMGVSFKRGENSYSKSKMTPFTLECAPKLIDDTTFVPVSFFEEVLEVSVEISE